MIVTADGIAFVGNFGFSIHPPGEPRTAVLACVDPDGHVSAAAEDLIFPNGMAITPDGATLIFSESGGYRLTAFDIRKGGALTNRRIWAQFAEGIVPDGMCLDAESAAWVALPLTNEFVRVREGGEIVDRVPVPVHALACVLGGEQRNKLYLMTSGSLIAEECRAMHSGTVRVVDVDVRGAGLP